MYTYMLREVYMYRKRDQFVIRAEVICSCMMKFVSSCRAKLCVLREMYMYGGGHGKRERERERENIERERERTNQPTSQPSSQPAKQPAKQQAKQPASPATTASKPGSQADDH